MKLVVVDASVVIKWFVEEEYSENALKLRDDYVNQLIDIAVPSLLFYEVMNALKYSHAFGEDELREVGSILEGYQFLVIPLEGKYREQTIRRAVKHGITIYDASYIAIGDLRGCKTYTADEKLITKVGGKDETITHIKHYKSPV